MLDRSGQPYQSTAEMVGALHSLMQKHCRVARFSGFVVYTDGLERPIMVRCLVGKDLAELESDIAGLGCVAFDGGISIEEDTIVTASGDIFEANEMQRKH